ncbi:MAG: Stp1/IreP family PP2C-type Ser/Thr phosphatase [Desulfomonilia bacterium]
MRLYGTTDVGLIRKNNEDSYLVDDEGRFCALADGMGGAAAGEIASRIFVETGLEVFSDYEEFTGDEGYELIQKTFGLANKRILDHVIEFPEHTGMGCTAELLAFTGEGFVLGHMGDSRTYRLRDGQLKQLTRDHSLVQDQLDQGIITPEQARNHAHKNVILRAVGVSQNPSLDIIRGKTFPGDLFLLCSDGLSDMVHDDLIASVCTSSADLEKKGADLISLAKQAGGKDNITVVLALIE